LGPHVRVGAMAANPVRLWSESPLGCTGLVQFRRMTVAAPVVRAASPGERAWPHFGPAGHWSLARQYLVASLVVVLVGVLITGAWIGHQIESSVLDRTAGITALYVDSVIGPNVQALAQDDRWLTTADTAALNRLVSTTGLGQ